MPAILGNRYELSQKIDSDQISESWLGVDADLSEYLIRVWKYGTENPDDSVRALWNSELRILYRLCSSPGATETLLTLHDAGLDRHNKAFVMVLRSDSGGYKSLDTALTKRSENSWLSLKELKNPGNRARLWAGLSRIARAVDLLHTQQVLHRNVAPENVYFDAALGAESLRLGGFAWSVRLSEIRVVATTSPWSKPPEASSSPSHTFDTDWYAFGMLLARTFYPIEAFGKHLAEELHRAVYNEIDQNRTGTLSEIERNLILRLIARRAEDRLIFGQDIIRHIEEIVAALSAGQAQPDFRLPLVLVVKPENIIDAAQKAGFQIESEEGNATFSPLNPEHVALLKKFIREHLTNACIYPAQSPNLAILVGHKLTLLICQFRNPRTDEENWDAAFVIKPAELSGSDGKTFTDLSSVPIHVVKPSEVSKQLEKQSWQRFLPSPRAVATWPEDLAKFHDFLRCTNQIELLMGSAELFQYETVKHTESDGFEFLIIKERETDRNLPPFCRIEGGLVEFLQREIDTNKPGCRKVLLTYFSSLRVSVDRDDWWHVTCIDSDSGVVKLTRATTSRSSGIEAPSVGWLRTFGLHGQIKLIERRKTAIDRLKNHSYLLRSLVQPGMVSIDIGAAPLPYALPIEKVDTSKTAVIEDILRVRPIYALQGPPGTGKTTLVAYLLREIFEDDPVAQVLVTAQAHGAVDILRNKVRRESFSDKEIDDQPLAIRIGVKESQDDNGAERTPLEDTVEEVSRRVLEKAKQRLEQTSDPSPIQRQWLQTLTQTLSPRTTGDNSFFTDFQRLVKQGASLTYCTTSAGDLADLAEGSQSFDWSFDWSVIEEAGKAHGFDLALPLQAGHRWMLLGDHRQLPPYRFTDYLAAVDDIDAVVDLLNTFEGADRSLLDQVWINEWKDKEEKTKRDFVEYVKRWLNAFERLLTNLSNIHGERLVTRKESIGAKAGILAIQYRMHPTIGNLISHAFYNDEIENGTAHSDGRCRDEFFHGLAAVGLPAELQIDTKALVWLDLPWCQHEPDSEEVGPKQGKPRYTNLHEVQAVREFISRLRPGAHRHSDKKLKLAILSPYNQQVALFNRSLQDVELPDHLELVESLTAARGSRQSVRWAHTVDSFQGNQADVIIVSLVRNNRKLPPDGLGFLKVASRLNVLLSRAERLLVLVGSCDFFEKQLELVSLDDIYNPLWPWKTVLDYIKSTVVTGEAVRIPVMDICKLRRQTVI